MTEQPPTPGPLTLTDIQQARVDFARRDAESTHAEDLAQLDAAALILVIEKLRRRLDDTLQLVDELIAAGQRPDASS
jgi:hypothetical protein